MNRERLVASLTAHEAERLKPYDDATGQTLLPGMTLRGQLTIGRGRNLTANGITPTESVAMLEHDIFVAHSFLKGFGWFLRLSDPQQRALVEMAFNLGAERFLGFHHMLDALAAGDTARAAAEMRASKWDTQVGARAQTLAQMVATGTDPA